MSKQSQVMTPEFRVSFPQVFRPDEGKDGKKPKYSVTMLFPKNTNLDRLKALRDAVLIEKFGSKERVPKGLRNPIRDGNEKDLDGYADHIFIAARSINRPGLVDASCQPIINEADFYAGCYARATVSAFYYDKDGNKGVSFSLNNIQKIRDGEPFSGRSRAEDDFGPVEGGDAKGVAAGSSDEMFG